MNIGHCRDCRWWALDSPDEEDARCARATVGLDCEIQDESSLCHAIADWTGDSGATLRTEPDFGCVQFEAKP